MGGYGSGDRTRPKKITCEAANKIDIRILSQYVHWYPVVVV